MGAKRNREKQSKRGPRSGVCLVVVPSALGARERGDGRVAARESPGNRGGTPSKDSGAKERSASSGLRKIQSLLPPTPATTALRRPAPRCLLSRAATLSAVPGPRVQSPPPLGSPTPRACPATRAAHERARTCTHMTAALLVGTCFAVLPATGLGLEAGAWGVCACSSGLGLGGGKSVSSNRCKAQVQHHFGCPPIPLCTFGSNP